MNLAYIIPERNYEFFGELIEPLESAGINVSVNDLAGADLILAGMLPATHEWIEPIKNGSVPYVLWHWDLYSFVDTSEPRWDEFLDMMPAAADVWSCSYETARQLKEQLEIDSVVIPAWVDERNVFNGITKDYVFYAATTASIGKRTDWAAHACRLLGLPLIMPVDGERMERKRYFRTMAECRVYLMTAFEESNGSIPAMEAAASGKPVVCADIPSNREVFGDTAYYFKACDFEDCKRQLKSAWKGDAGHSREYIWPVLGKNRISRNYALRVVSKQIIERLSYVQGRSRRLHVQSYHG